MSDVLVPTPHGQMPCWLAAPPLPNSEPRAGHGPDVLRYRDVVYNEAATLDARRRIAAFLHAHLD